MLESLECPGYKDSLGGEIDVNDTTASQSSAITDPPLSSTETSITPDSSKMIEPEIEEFPLALECSNGRQPSGACIEGRCTDGYICEDGVCCRKSSNVVTFEKISAIPKPIRPFGFRRRTTTTKTPISATSSSAVIVEELQWSACPAGEPLGSSITPAVSCSDVLKRCDVTMCSHRGYYEFMTRFCTKTCRRCERV
ncbi:unnamed protein product [Enterobius vermicularis]|uniref:ShKT domain-containing protein n=1 Tax=Enterobius vermicularis TaxID=51028 RepID=A0A0N4V2P1_ENTVE|nr:unnamed protein product [Enterobius vermicularis]